MLSVVIGGASLDWSAADDGQSRPSGFRARCDRLASVLVIRPNGDNEEWARTFTSNYIESTWFVNERALIAPTKSE